MGAFSSVGDVSKLEENVLKKSILGFSILRNFCFFVSSIALKPGVLPSNTSFSSLGFFAIPVKELKIGEKKSDQC